MYFIDYSTNFFNLYFFYVIERFYNLSFFIYNKNIGGSYEKEKEETGSIYFIIFLIVDQLL